MTTTLNRESTLDFNHRPTFSDKINGLIDVYLQGKNAEEPERDYLGASEAGRILQPRLAIRVYPHTA